MAIKHSKTIRILIIFCLVALNIGWIGVGVDRLFPDQEEEETLGTAIWLIIPLIVVIVLRTSINFEKCGGRQKT